MTDKSQDIMFLYNIIDILKEKMHTMFVTWIVCLSWDFITVCEWSFNKRGERSRRTVACQGLLECPWLQAMNITNIVRLTKLQLLIIYTSQFIFSKKKTTWFRHAWLEQSKMIRLKYAFLGNLNLVQFKLDFMVLYINNLF